LKAFYVYLFSVSLAACSVQVSVLHSCGMLMHTVDGFFLMGCEFIELLMASSSWLVICELLMA
jgi:hypothetical protein